MLEKLISWLTPTRVRSVRWRHANTGFSVTDVGSPTVVCEIPFTRPVAVLSVRYQYFVVDDSTTLDTLLNTVSIGRAGGNAIIGGSLESDYIFHEQYFGIAPDGMPYSRNLIQYYYPQLYLDVGQSINAIVQVPATLTLSGSLTVIYMYTNQGNNFVENDFKLS